MKNSNRMPFDPGALVTSDAELKSLFAEYAERRLRFTEACLSRSALGGVMRAVGAESSHVNWAEAGLAGQEEQNLLQRGFTAPQVHLVFAHPTAIAADPSRIEYYRRLLSMSGKVFGRLFPKLSRLQSKPPVGALTTEQLSELVDLNGVLARVAARSGFLPEEPVRLVIASEGASIDGDWRNQTGRVATWRTLEFMLAAVAERDVRRVQASKARTLEDITNADASVREDRMDEGWKPESLELVSGYRIRFGPQSVLGVNVSADVTVTRTDDHGEPIAVTCAGEVKGTTDPANAKERWRLAAGNVEAMNRIRSGRARSRPTTFYMGLVITEAVVDGDAEITGMRELLDRRALDYAFSLVKLADPREFGRFRDFFRDQVEL